jgi:hypothetical protein
VAAVDAPAGVAAPAVPTEAARPRKKKETDSTRESVSIFNTLLVRHFVVLSVTGKNARH